MENPSLRDVVEKCIKEEEWKLVLSTSYDFYILMLKKNRLYDGVRLFKDLLK